MSDDTNSQPTTMFWLIGGAALLWNLIGMMFYYLQVTMAPDVLATLPENQQTFFNSIPAWATSAHAIAVTAGVLGCVLLLMRNAFAIPAFVISLAGILVQNLHAFVVANGLQVFGAAGAALPAIVIAIAIGLVLHSRNAKASGVLS